MLKKDQVVNDVEVMKTESKLGVWLRFFWIINILWLISFPLAASSMVYVFMVPPIETSFAVSDGIYLLSLLPNLVFSILILKLISVSEPSTPDRLKKLIALEFLAHITVAVISKEALSLGYISGKPGSISIYHSLIYAFVCIAYLVKSKHVLKYYGSNATKSLIR